MAPYRDEHGHKGFFQAISRASAHVVQRVTVVIPGWPITRPLRIAFLSDLHAGSHADDATRLTAIVAEAASFAPHLVLHGGDFMNMQLIGGGRLSPRKIAKIIAPLKAPLGCFAVLGDHDQDYGSDEIIAALAAEGVATLNDEKRNLIFEGKEIDLIGLPGAHRIRDAARTLLATLSPATPTIVLTHDPYRFAHVPSGPHITLAGHTHGGQIRFPRIGAIYNASRAPLRWTYGLVKEGDKSLYVSGGLGTSGIPLRIGIPPEYAILELRGPAAR